MSAPDYLIKNCPGNASSAQCPTAWSRLRTSFSDAVRHCNACNRKVYLCLNEQDIKFYSSLKYPIAVDSPDTASALANLRPMESATVPVSTKKPAPVMREEASQAVAAATAEASTGAQLPAAPSVWRRAPRLSSEAEFSVEHFARDEDMPAFMRLLGQPR